MIILYFREVKQSEKILYYDLDHPETDRVCFLSRGARNISEHGPFSSTCCKTIGKCMVSIRARWRFCILNKMHCCQVFRRPFDVAIIRDAGCLSSVTFSLKLTSPNVTRPLTSNRSSALTYVSNTFARRQCCNRYENINIKQALYFTLSILLSQKLYSLTKCFLEI